MNRQVGALLNLSSLNRGDEYVIVVGGTRGNATYKLTISIK